MNRSAALFFTEEKLKFFKHFTDAHRGSSLQLLRQKHGMAAVGRYWVFVELCAEKMSKERNEEYSEKHTVFEFAKPYLVASLGYANLKQLSSYLQALSDLGLCSVEDKGDVWLCSMPKLLECLDRDANRARPARASDAPKNKRKNKEEEKEKDLKEVTEEKVLPEDPFFKKQHNRHELNEAAKIWNENCGDLVKIRMLTKNWAQRSDALIAEYGADNFRKGVVSVASNKFLTGNSRSKWKATFTWIIKDDNLAKVLVGDYASENGVESMINELSRELGLS